MLSFYGFSPCEEGGEYNYIMAKYTDEEVLQLWRNPEFSGAFTGLSTFKSALEYEKNIKISRKKLFDILRRDKNFLLETKKIQKVPVRRKTIQHGYGTKFEIDLGQMFEFEGYNYFLACIDVYSRRAFARALKTKTAKEVEDAFKSVCEEAQVIPDVVQTDQGKEFRPEFFKQQGVYLKFKLPPQKASFAGRRKSRRQT